MPATADILYLLFVSIMIAFTVGLSFIALASSIRVGLVLMLSGFNKIADKFKNTD